MGNNAGHNAFASRFQICMFAGISERLYRAINKSVRLLYIHETRFTLVVVITSSITFFSPRSIRYNIHARNIYIMIDDSV